MLQKQIKDDLGIDASVFSVNVYTIAGIHRSDAEILGRELLADPITHGFSLRPAGNQKDWDYAVEIAYKPGVTDNTGNTVSTAMADIIDKSYPVYTSRQYLLKGVTRNQAEAIASLLHNPQIERSRIKSKKQWGSRTGMGIYLPFAKF